MKDKQIINTGWDCFVCGSGVLVYTDADQHPEGEPRDYGMPSSDGKGWYCADGDLVKCPDCGAEGHVSCDGDGGAEFSYDEMTAHNLDCALREADKHIEKQAKKIDSLTEELAGVRKAWLAYGENGTQIISDLRMDAARCEVLVKAAGAFQVAEQESAARQAAYHAGVPVKGTFIAASHPLCVALLDGKRRVGEAIAGLVEAARAFKPKEVS